MEFNSKNVDKIKNILDIGCTIYLLSAFILCAYASTFIIQSDLYMTGDIAYGVFSFIGTLMIMSLVLVMMEDISSLKYGVYCLMAMFGTFLITSDFNSYTTNVGFVVSSAYEYILLLVFKYLNHVIVFICVYKIAYQIYGVFQNGIRKPNNI